MNITWTGSAHDNLFQTPGNWNPAQVPGASDDVTITAAATIIVTGSPTVNSLSLGAQAVLDIASGFTILASSTINGTVNVNDAESFSIAGTITGTGTIALNSTNDNTDLIISGTKTMLSGGASILLSDNANNYVYGASSAETLDNVDDTISGAGQLGASQLTLVNSGVIDATGKNAALVLDTTAATNTGTIEATGSAGLVIKSTITNTGGIIAAKGGSVFLEGGTLAGGTLQSSGGAGFFVEGSGTLDGSSSTIDNTAAVQVNDEGLLNLLGNIDNRGTLGLESANDNTDLVIGSGTVVLSGGGSVVLSDNANNYVYGATSTDTLDNVDNTISGAGRIGNDQLTLVNSGTIDANGNNSLVIDTSTATNTGTLEATGKGGLSIFNAAITNTGGIIDAKGGSVYLQGGTIAGGTLQNSGGAGFFVEGSGTLDGSSSTLHNAATVQVDDEGLLNLLGNIDNRGTLGLASANDNTDLVIGSATVMLSGGGSVVLSDNANNYVYGATSTDNLDNVDNTISGAGRIGNDQLTLVNSGTIDANGNNSLVIDTSTATNTGTLEATGKGGLSIFNAAITNTGGVIAAKGGSVYLQGGTIAGGTLQDSGGTGFFVEGSGTLDGSSSTIDNTAAVQVDDNANLNLLGNIDNSGILGLASANDITSLIIGSGTVKLSGGGSVVLSDNANNYVYGATGTETLDNVDNTLSGAGVLGFNGTAVINSGTIDATGRNAELQLRQTTVTNTGTIEATGSAGLLIQNSTITNTGGIIDADGGSVYLQGGIIAGGTLQDSGGAGFFVQSSCTFDSSSSTLHNAATVQVNDNGSLNLLGNIDNSGELNVSSANDSTQLIINGATVKLSGGGSVVLSDNANNYVYGATGTETLDNVDNTLSGGGVLGYNGMAVINSGTIDATGRNAALQLRQTTVTNTGTLEATGSAGLLIHTATITNTGGIIAANGGNVVMDSTSVLTNDSAGTLTGGTYEAIGDGISLSGASIVSDAATIELSGTGSSLQTAGGSTVDASLLSIASTGKLELLGGRSFSAQTHGGALNNAGALVLGGGTLTAALTNGGTVSGSGEITGTLVNTGAVTATGGLLDVAEAATGNFSIAGTGILELAQSATTGTIGFAGGIELKLDAPGSFTDALGSLAGGDVVAVRGVVTSAVIEGTTDLKFVEAGTTYEYQLSGASAGLGTTLKADGLYTDIVVQAACYLRGTYILTPRGEVPVERLRVGDFVLTASGLARPVRWLGHRRIDCRTYPDPAVVWPVCIKAGAVAPDLPIRDLWVSPGHSMWMDGVLIQAEKLINDATIQRVPRARVEYWHVELDSHDILVAEGLPSESYLDTGNRTAFVNGGDFLEAHPDFKPRHWADTCVPLALKGPALHRARAALIERAQTLGHALTEDADAHVWVDGRRVNPVPLDANRLAFLWSARSTAELRCRTFIPAHMSDTSDDARPLGLCVKRLELNGTNVPLGDEAAFAAGWHELESTAQIGDHGAQWRWSTGRVPLPAGTRLLLIDMALRGRFWSAPPVPQIVTAFEKPLAGELTTPAYR